MRATDFEYCHQTLVHQCIVAFAFLTYLIQRDHIVWQFVRNSAMPRELERALFIVATFLIAVGAGIGTGVRAHQISESTAAVKVQRYLHRLRYLGDFVYAVGLASLAPLSGFILLVIGEALRLFRLMRREEGDGAQGLQQNLFVSPSSVSAYGQRPGWGRAFRQEVVKWCLVFTMIVFIVTLKDRQAEILAGISFLVGLVCNASFFHSSSSVDAHC